MRSRTQQYIIVWGATGGVGMAITKNLCESGIYVLAYCRNPEELEHLGRQYPTLIIRAFTIDEAFYIKERQHLQQAGYRIAGMVDCVGSIAVKEGASLTDRMHGIMQANLYHQYYAALTFKDLLQPGSSIVFLSSVRAVTGTDNSNIEYAFAKAALEILPNH